MTKLGTPIGAGPKVARVRLGLVSAGEPSGLRSAGCSIFDFSPLAMSLAPRPFLACLPNSPGVLPPVVFLPAVPPPDLPDPLLPPLPPPLEPPPVMPLTMPPAPPESPVDPPLEVGALYSELSVGPLQPGSLRSERPSPSSSERFAHCGSTCSVPGTVTVTLPTPTVPEIAVPAATMAKVAPRAMITRTFLVIWLAVPARDDLRVCRLRPPCTRRHGGRY